MAHDEKDKILHLRNEISLYLDDLAAQVVNSSLASNIRRFSIEIMELEPGFTFGLKQARLLLDETRKAEKQYRAKAIDDTALMGYLNEAQSILKGETIPPDRRVNFMGILDKLRHGDDYKVKQLTQTINKQELQFNKICEEIQAYEAEMNHCVEASRACAPNSATYRNNERKYNTAKENLILKNKEADILNDLLKKNINTLQLLLHQEVIGGLDKDASKSPVSEGDIDNIVATLQIEQEELNRKLATSNEAMRAAYEASETKARPVSEFAAKVAASERRDAMMEMAGVDIPKKEENSNPQSEFDRLVNDANAKN